MFGKIKFEIGMLRFKLDQRRKQRHFERMRPELKRDQARRNLKILKASYFQNVKVVEG